MQKQSRERVRARADGSQSWLYTGVGRLLFTRAAHVLLLALFHDRRFHPPAVLAIRGQQYTQR